MKRRFTAMLTMATAALSFVVAGQAAAEPPWPPGTSSAVFGTKRGWYVRSAGQTSWTHLVGVRISSPAVAIVGEGPEQVTP